MFQTLSKVERAEILIHIPNLIDDLQKIQFTLQVKFSQCLPKGRHSSIQETQDYSTDKIILALVVETVKDDIREILCNYIKNCLVRVPDGNQADLISIGREIFRDSFEEVIIAALQEKKFRHAEKVLKDTLEV